MSADDNLPAESLSSLLDPSSIYLRRVLEAGLKFHSWLHSARTEEEKDAIEEELSRRPELNRYRMASFAMFFNRAVPSKSFLFHGKVDSGKKVTPEDLESANLSDEQLRKIAGIE